MVPDCVRWLTEQGLFVCPEHTLALSAGASGAGVWRVLDGSCDSVVKTDTDRQRAALETGLYRLFADLPPSPAPPLRFAGETALFGGVLVTEYREPMPAGLWSESDMRLAMQLLAHIHTIDIASVGRLGLRFEPVAIEAAALEAADGLWRSILSANTELHSDVIREARSLVGAAVRICNEGVHVFCHGDYHTGNLLRDGQRLLACDWACAHVGKAAGDIAFFLSRGRDTGLQLTEEQAISWYCEAFANLTGAPVEPQTLLTEMRASDLINTYCNWPYYLQGAPAERVRPKIDALRAASNVLRHRV